MNGNSENEESKKANRRGADMEADSNEENGTDKGGTGEGEISDEISGGILVRKTGGEAHAKWKLTHPLSKSQKIVLQTAFLIITVFTLVYIYGAFGEMFAAERKSLLQNQKQLQQQEEQAGAGAGAEKAAAPPLEQNESAANSAEPVQNDKKK